ncbi:MAG: hypothetical protein GY822_30180 [Deltaproteobacteria bacterium]|nr:hypothetical protein [Deltaproteobacteria bacterium]
MKTLPMKTLPSETLTTLALTTLALTTLALTTLALTTLALKALALKALALKALALKTLALASLRSKLLHAALLGTLFLSGGSAFARTAWYAGAVTRDPTLSSVTQKVDEALQKALQKQGLSAVIAAQKKKKGGSIEPVSRLLKDARGRFFDADFRGA